ncbi:hypothetical protein ACM66B_002026 [Microbotryomycetes sp. NB124-2]
MDIPPPPPKHPSVAARLSPSRQPARAAAAPSLQTSSQQRPSLLQPIQTTTDNAPTAITVEPPTPVAHQQQQQANEQQQPIQLLDDSRQRIIVPSSSSSVASDQPSDIDSDSDSDSDSDTTDEDDDDSSTEDERRKEAVLRRVANEIVSQQEQASPASPVSPEGAWSTGIGGWSGLRRRVTLRQAQQHSLSPQEAEHLQTQHANSSPLTPEEQEVRSALEELEDVEVATFLSRASKRMSQVNVLPPAVDPVYPKRETFMTDGKTDWVAFAIAYAMTLAEAYCPPALLAQPRREDLSIKFLRGELERLYVIAPPAQVNDFVTDELSAIWRWESSATWKWLALYSFAWVFNLIPMLPFAYLAYRIMRARMYPPDARQLLTESSLRVLRTEQAAKLSKQLKATHASGYAGMAFAGAKGLVSQIRKRAGSSATVGTRGALASALGASAAVGGLGGVRLSATDGLTSRENSSRLSQNENNENRTEVEQGEDEDVSLFQVLRDIARTAGPSGQDLLEQAADLGEKIKNVILHPEHPSVPMVLLRLAAICLFIIVTPAWIQLKAFWLYLGVEFFALFRLRELFPRYRRALTPVWWIFLGAPTDSQLAAFIMRKRHLQQKPILGRKTIKRKINRLSALGSASNDSHTSLATRSRSSSINSSVDSLLLSRSSTLDQVDEAAVLASHFALHMAVPGELVMTSDHIKFVAMRSLRTIAPKLHKMARKWEKYQRKRDHGKVSADGADTSTDKRAFSAKVKDVYEVKIKVLDIIGVRKDQSRLDLLEGITVTDKRGKEWKFTNVSRRDEAFNRLVSLTPATLKAS